MFINVIDGCLMFISVIDGCLMCISGLYLFLMCISGMDIVFVSLINKWSSFGWTSNVFDIFGVDTAIVILIDWHWLLFS